MVRTSLARLKPNKEIEDLTWEVFWLAFKALVRVAGLDLPEPSTYSGNTATLVDSGRNVQGELIGCT